MIIMDAISLSLMERRTISHIEHKEFIIRGFFKFSQPENKINPSLHLYQNLISIIFPQNLRYHTKRALIY